MSERKLYCVASSIWMGITTWWAYSAADAEEMALIQKRADIRNNDGPEDAASLLQFAAILKSDLPVGADAIEGESLFWWILGQRKVKVSGEKENHSTC